MKETTYSWSRVNYTCLAAFYQNYVLENKGEDNIWNVGGKFEHDLMEHAAKDEMTQEDCLEAVKNSWYDAVDGLDNPFGYYNKEGELVEAAEHYYNKTLPFFTKENTNWLLGETVSVEEHLEFTLPSGKKFQGFVDRVSVDSDGKSNLTIRDYKISKRFTRKNVKEKSRQLYVYAYGYHQIHGQYPEQLIFEFFQFWDKPKVIKFNKADMDEAIEFAEGRILEIEGRLKVEKMGMKGMFTPDYKELLDEKGERNMFCKSVCGFRSSCPFIDGNHLKMFKTKGLQDIEIKK